MLFFDTRQAEKHKSEEPFHYMYTAEPFHYMYPAGREFTGPFHYMYPAGREAHK